MKNHSEESSDPKLQTAVQNVAVSGNFTIGSITQIIKNIVLTDRQKEDLNARKKLLKGVKGDINAFLRQSLYEGKQIDLRKEQQARQVESKRAQVSPIALPESQPLPPNKKMIDIFDEASQKLLILGEPGAGKTIALLRLALELVALAEATIDNPDVPNTPIPILLNLATWKTSQPIKDWIIEQLKLKGVNRELSRKWFNRKDLIPLLDELDRLSTDHQEECIKAINDLLQKEYQPDGLVVCSRLDEYRNHSSRNIRLRFEDAICLKPLTEPQVNAYLNESIGNSELWENVKKDISLLEIIKSPLFLGILVWTLAPQEILTERRRNALKRWQKCKSKKELRHYFFKIFIEQMLTRELKSQNYYKHEEPSSEETKKWLTQLAKVIKKKSSTEFIIENIQPNWWLSETEEKIYGLVVWSVFGLISGLTSGLYLFGWSHQPPVLILAILSGLGSGVISYISLPFLSNLTKTVSRISSKALPGFLFFVSMYILTSPIPIELTDWNFLILLTGIGVGVGFYGLSPSQIKAADKVEFSYRRAVQFVGFAFLIGIIAVPIHVLMSPELYIENPAYGVYELFTFVLVGLLVGAMPGAEAKIDLKHLPNQGIWRTRNYSVMWFLLGGSIGGLFTVTMDGPEIIRTTGIILSAGLLSSLIGCSNSGIVCVQHFVLRTILYGKTCMPWNYARFLDYATERVLLQRVGGRYRFWHDLLREHFAEMEV